MTTSLVESTPTLVPVPATGPGWEPSEYAPTIHASGAEKLSASGVAPLVAVARGMVTVTEKTAVQTVPSITGGTRRSRGAQWVLRSAATGDALIIPWYSATEVLTAAHRRTYPASCMVQARPAEPIVVDGEPRKYDTLAGGTSPVDLHPATPASYVAEPRRVIVAEGMAKRDSILTAVLLASGVSRDDLALTEDERTALAAPDQDARRAAARAAAERLGEILAGVPTRHRVLVLGLVGVGNWHHNPEWNAIDLRGEDGGGVEVLVAFDADVSSNAQVHGQARQLWTLLEHKGANVGLLRPTMAGDPHAGADDFLAVHGMDLDALLETAVDALPAPPAPPARPGERRMDLDRGICEVYEVDTETGRGWWREDVPFAGRLAALRSYYSATDAEIAEGVIPEPNAARRAGMEIDVAWAEPGGVQTGTIRGPLHLLDQDTREISRSADHYPPELVAQPGWPPRRDWVEAAKRAGMETRTSTARWAHSGYVPTPAGMVFLSGDDCVDADGYSDVTEPGVAELYPASSEYGLHPTTDRATGRGMDREAVAAAVRETLDLYLRGWRDPGLTGLVLAAALRPAAPVSTNSTIFLSGKPGSGKSFTARMIVQFHRRSRKTWVGEHLTGGASSTAYYTEQLLSATPLYVADDLAPSASQRQADEERAKVANLIRSVHNKSSRGRGTPHQTGARAEYPPRAIFIVSAEELLPEASAMNRTVHCPFDGQQLGRTEAESADWVADAKRFVQSSMAPAQTFTAAVQMVLDQERREGWGEVQEDWAQLRVDAEAYADGLLRAAGMADTQGGLLDRAAGKAGDLLLGLEVLERLLHEVDLYEDYSVDLARVRYCLVRLVGRQMDRGTETTPGRRIVAGLAADLAAGRCHVVTPGSGMPPTADDPDDTVLPQRLGWTLPGASPIDARPQGLTVGILVRKELSKSDEPVYGEWCVLVDHGAATSVLTRQGGPLTPGMGVSSALEAARSEGLASSDWAVTRGRQRVTVHGHTYTGTAIPLRYLLGGLAESDPTGAESD